MAKIFTEVVSKFHLAIESIEELSIEILSLPTIIKLLTSGIPIGIALDRLITKIYSHAYRLPILSSFASAWKQDSSSKIEHLGALRNLIIFTIGVASVANLEKNRQCTADFVIDRVMSISGQKNINGALQTPHRAIFEGAHELMLNTGTEENYVQQQLEAEVRRRGLRENRNN